MIIGARARNLLVLILLSSVLGCQAVAPKLSATAGTPSSITCILDKPGKVMLGDRVGIRGAISPERIGADVTLSYIRPDGTTLTRAVTTSRSGRYRDIYTPDMPGSWEVSASWTGDSDYTGATSLSVSFSVTGLPSGTSRITCFLDSSSTTAGSPVKIFGSIFPAHSTTVTIESTSNEASWNTLVTQTSGPDGSFDIIWTWTSPGKYTIRARWAGDKDTKGDTSKPVRINVVALPLSPLTREGIATWTFMVYMAADNDLGSNPGGGKWDIYNLNEMRVVGSTSNVNIIVLWDTAPTPTNPTKILRVTSNPLDADVVHNYGVNLDTGDPQTLVNFISWTATNYPAENYLLDLWGHGSGFTSLCSDDTTGNSLDMIKLKNALANAGTRFSIVGFDSCLMGMSEIFYQIRGWTDYFVGSEEEVPAAGWPYNWILGDLTSNPDWSPSVVASMIVEEYQKAYSVGGSYTMAAAQTLQSSNLENSVKSFGGALEKGIPTYRSQIKCAFDHSEYFTYSYFIDLYDFANLIKQNATIVDPAIMSGADSTMSAVTSSVIYEWHDTGHPSAHGLSIYGESSSSGYLASYDGLDFSWDTSWNEFVRAYLGLAPHMDAVSDTALEITSAGENTVYFIYPNYAGPKPPGVTYALLSDWTAMGFVAGMCSNIQNEVTDTNPAAINTGTGEVKLQDTTVLLSGGPAVNAPVYYYEQNRIAPLYFQNVGGTYYFYKADGSRLDNTALSAGQLSSHDLFVVESFTDNSGNRVLIIYGYGWKGTFAGGKFFKFIMYPNISSYTNSYYVFRWDDANRDGFVDLNEISTTPVATG